MRITGLMSLVLAATFALGGCTSKSDKKTAEGVNVLRKMLTANVRTLDSADAYDAISWDVLPNIVEPPLQYHYLKRPYTLEPLLSDGMPEMSKDGLTLTMKIKKGIRYQDDAAFKDGKGREVVADDFIYAWKRIADPANRSQGFFIFDKKIVGINDYRTKLGKKEIKFDAPVEGMTALDKYTVQLKFTKPYPQILHILAMPFTAPVPHEALTKYVGFPTPPDWNRPI